MMRLRLRLTTLGLALSLPLACPAQTDGPGGPETFAKEFVNVVNGKNTERRLALLHSATHACVNAQTRPYYDWIFSRQLKRTIPATYKVTASAVPGDAPLTSDGKSDYPLRPTHRLQIDFETGPHRSTSIILLVARDGGDWREVLPCLRAETIADIRAAETQRAEQERRVRSLAANLADPLRAEIVALARDGRRIDAIRKYRDATGEDLSTAKSVVDTLVSGQP